VEPIDPQVPARDGRRRDLTARASCARLVPTRGPAYGHALALAQAIAVADQLQGRHRGIAAAQQPGEVRAGPAQTLQARRAERLAVARVGATMAAGVRHRKSAPLVTLTLVRPHQLGLGHDVTLDRLQEARLVETFGEVERLVECVQLEEVAMDPM